MTGMSLKRSKSIVNFNRLSTRFLLTLTLISVIPLVFAGLTMMSVMRDSLAAYIEEQQREIARRAGNEIRLFVKTPETILQILLESQDIIEMNSFSQNLILNKVISANPIFNRLFTIDSLGNEITTTDFTPYAGTYRDQDFFRRSIKNEFFFSNVKFNQIQEPYVLLSYPIHRFDQTVGVLAGEVDLKSIWDLVDSLKLGQHGSAFVVGSEGELIAHPDKKKVLERQYVQKSLIQSIKGEAVVSRGFRSSEGERYLGTFSYIPEINWVIVIQIPEEEAYAVVSGMLLQILIIVGVVIAISILASYLLEKRITAPINTLVEGVKAYADGELKHRMQINRYEEIAVLASEFNNMAEKLDQSRIKLQRIERLAAMSKFASLISHEIRNPLNSMTINLRILEREMEKSKGSPEIRRKYFNILISEIQRMDHLISNFLMISRPPNFNFVPTVIDEILNEVVFMHLEKAKSQDVNIITQNDQQEISAIVDRDQIKQVFHNIIINALEAMPEGGKLHISSIKNGAFCVIKFIDTGTGIPKEKIQEIFDYYFSLKKTGTGLGLAIARQIIEAHEGTIAAENNKKQGAVFILRIPLKRKRELQGNQS
jgi:two-component system, sporulation sensor kinase E